MGFGIRERSSSRKRNTSNCVICKRDETEVLSIFTTNKTNSEKSIGPTIFVVVEFHMLPFDSTPAENNRKFGIHFIRAHFLMRDIWKSSWAQFKHDFHIWDRITYGHRSIIGNLCAKCRCFSGS